MATQPLDFGNYLQQARPQITGAFDAVQGAVTQAQSHIPQQAMHATLFQRNLIQGALDFARNHVQNSLGMLGGLGQTPGAQPPGGGTPPQQGAGQPQGQGTVPGGPSTGQALDQNVNSQLQQNQQPVYGQSVNVGTPAGVINPTTQQQGTGVPALPAVPGLGSLGGGSSPMGQPALTPQQRTFSSKSLTPSLGSQINQRVDSRLTRAFTAGPNRRG